jgi:hypothetical protein
VGWYPFNGNTNDESGNGNHGVNNGGILDSDKDGNINSSYYFDGNSGIDIPNSELPNDFTITFWFKTDFDSTTSQGLYYPVELFSDSVPDFPGIGVTDNLFLCGSIPIDSSVVFVFDGESGCTNHIESEYFNQSDFHFVSLRRNDTIYKLSLDGVTIVDDSTLNSFHINKIQIGRRMINWGFKGIIDDIGLWNRSLSDEEITDVYNQIPTGMFSQKLYRMLNIYPNPTKDFLQIDCGDISSMNGYSIKIINSLGQSLFDEPVTQSPFSIDMNGWNGNGLYFLHLIDGSGNITDIRKIVLQ